MKKKVSIAIIVIFIIIVSIIFFNFIESNDDFAPYTNKEYDEVYDITSDIYDLASTKYELTKIAQKYEDGVRLTYAQYNIEKNNKTAEFQFYNDTYNGKNKACIVTIAVDIDTQKTTKIRYEKGHGKRVSGHSTEINISENISNYINPDENIKIVVVNDEITVYKDGQKIETNDFIKDITNNLSGKYSYDGIITEMNSDNIIFENQSSKKKYSLKFNNNFKYINGRTNEEINVNDIKVGYYIDTSPYGESKVISILSNIKGEELRKELLKNFSLENPLYLTISPLGTNMKIINKDKAILTITFDDLLPDYNTDGGKFEMKIEINPNTVIECKGGINKIEELGDVALDIIKIKLDKNTINNKIPIATWFMSSNGN